MYHKLLLAYNGSHEGKVALLECADLAKFSGAEIHLLAIVPLQPSVFLAEGYVPDNLLAEDTERYRTILNEGVDALRERGFEQVQGHLVTGEAVTEVCRIAQELGCDLIVVGHRHRTSWADRWWNSSVGSSLVEYAPCSILVSISH